MTKSFKTTSGNSTCARRGSRAKALSLAAGAALSVMAMATSAQAQVFNWANNTSTSPQNWSVATNWIGPAPVAGGSINDTVNLNYNFGSGAFASNNDLAGTYNLNTLNMSAQAAGTATTGFSLTGGTLAFNTNGSGAGPSLVNSNSSFGGISSLISLVNTTTISGSGVGALTMSGVISGAGGLVLGTTGPGVVGLNAANTFLGGTTMNSGEVSTSVATGMGPAGSTVTVNGGRLRLSAAATLSQNYNITPGSTFNITGAFAPTFSGSITGSGGISYRPTASATITFTGSNSFSGNYYGQAFGNAVPSITLNSNGAWTGVSGITMEANQTLLLDNAATNVANRINDTAPISLMRAGIQLNGNAAATSETLGAITFSGSNSFATTPNAASNTTLTVASMARANRGSAIFTGTNMGTVGGANTSNFIVTAPSITGDLVGGGGLPGSTNVSILPYAYAAHTVGGVSAGQLVTYDPVTGIRPLAAAEYVPSAIVARGSSTNNNFKSSGAARMIGVTGVNAMVIDSASAAAIGSGVYGSGVLKPASGVTMFSVSGGGTASTLPSILATDVLELGSNEGIIHTQNLGAITSIISGSNGLTKSGFAPLILAGNNKYTGTTSITGSILHIASDSALGDPSNGISLSGGNVSGLNFAPSNLFGSTTVQSLTINRPVSLDGAGGGLSASTVNSTLTMNGVISGSGRLLTGTGSLGNTGVLKLTNTNTYSGATIIFGNVAVTSDGALGTNSEVVGTGGFLRADGPVTSARNFTLSGSLPLLTNGFNMTLNGTISNQAATPGTLSKGGAGNTLTLTGNSQFNGGVQVGLAAPLGDMDHLDTGGTMVLSGNGALTAVTGVSILSGSTFRLDNTGTNNGNRINANVSLGGGTFEFLGNGSAASTETIGTLNATSFSPAVGNGVGLVNLVPGAGQSAVVTASGFTRTGVGSMLVRGNNLGGAIGANTANLVFNTAPTLTNGVIPGVVVDNSLVGSGTDLATYTAGTGVRALNGAEYTVNPGAFAAATNADLTVNTATPTATVNAVRMGGGAGGITIAAANTLTVGSGMVLATGGGNSGITGGTLAFGTVPATIWANDNTLISSVITGTGGMNKAGPGTLTIGTAATLTTGGVTISNGRLVYGVANAFPTGTAITLGTTGTSIGTLDLNGTTSTVASFGGFGNIDLNGGNLISAGGATAFAGGIVGTGTVTLGGSMTINGVSSYIGDTTVRNAGTLTVGANQPTVGNGPLGSGGNLVLGDATTAGNLSFGTNVGTMNKNIVVPAGTGLSTITQNASSNVNLGGNISINRQVRITGGSSTAAPYTGTCTLLGTISGSGSLDWFGGNFNLYGNNTFTGGVQMQSGSATTITTFMGIGHDNALGTGNVNIAGFPAGVLRADNGARTVPNNFYFSGTATGIGFGGMNDFNIGGQFDLGAGAFAAATPPSVGGARTFQVTNTGVTRLLGIVSGNAASTLTKVGGGTLLMSANNTFAGNVNVNAGALIVNGNNSGAGVYAVANGALLGGSGTIAGAVSFAAGAALEPGNSAGTISTGAMTLAANSIMMWELGDSTIPTASDLAAVTGNLSIAGGVGTVVLHLETLPGFALLNGKTTWTIMTYTGTLTGAPANFLLANVPAGVTGAVIDTTTVPGSVILSMVPAPGTGGLLAMAGILASRRRRRN